MEEFLSAQLAQIEAAGLLRKLRRIDSAQGSEVICDGRRLLNFSSNDYLGLASHPNLKAAAEKASGSGAGASRLVCGTFQEHEALEDSIIRFKGTEAALSFSSGYAAALGAIPALAGEKDVIILDKLCHASLVDAARLSGAMMRVFPHNNCQKLESHLLWAKQKHPKARILILIESVYSMDGDVAPLREIVELKDRHGAWLFLDEAHAVGVIGRNGRGLADDLGVADRIEIQMGTLGKALGSHGAYLTGSKLLREYLINRARSFIYSTAPPPAVAASAHAAVELLASGEAEPLREKLWKNIRHLSKLLNLPASPSSILPVILGEESKAVAAAAQLLETGILVPAIRYPTVARGAARLRITVSASHEQEQIETLAAGIAKILG